MKFFADTVDIDAIKDLADLGMLDGVTTNPSIIAKSGANFLEVIPEIPRAYLYLSRATLIGKIT